jgi:hypothetical protein
VDVYRQSAAAGDPAAPPHTDFRNSLGARLGRLGPGSFFGEEAVMAGRPGVRQRTAVSRLPCKFHVLHKQSLDELRVGPVLLEHWMEMGWGAHIAVAVSETIAS